MSVMHVKRPIKLIFVILVPETVAYLGLFSVNWVPLIMKKHKLSSELDYYAEYCTLSIYFVNPGGNDW